MFDCPPQSHTSPNSTSSISAASPPTVARMVYAVGAPPDSAPDGCGGSSTAQLPSAAAEALTFAAGAAAPVARSVTTTWAAAGAPKPQMLARAGACLVRAAQAQ